MNWAELHERAVRGERAAALALYEAVEAGVFRQCLLATRGDRDAAQDLAQVCWERLFRSLHQLRQPEAFVSWALSTATRVAAEKHRLDHRRAALLERVAVEASLDSGVGGEEDQARREALVRMCLQELEDSAHKGLALAVYVQGMSTREAAQQLGIPHGTVTVTLMRLRVKLRAALARELLDEERP